VGALACFLRSQCIEKLTATISGAFILFVFTGNADSQGNQALTVNADLRLRYEFMDNFNKKFYGDDPPVGKGADGFLLGRFRLGIEWQLLQNLQVAVGIQHADVWDSSFPEKAFHSSTFGMEHNPHEDGWEPYDTYVKVKNLFNAPLAVTLGRQKIAYGNNRVFGPGQWGNTGRWIWDAAKISVGDKEHFLDAFYGRTQVHDPNRVTH